MAQSSQKFIARNRAPRVQIEYDVEVYGAEKKTQLPFVMGVFSDLAGKTEAPQPSVAERKFLEIDVDSFDDRMKAMKPRAAFTVPNTLTGEGQLAVDLTFERMEDFSPAAVAAKIAPLRALLDARTQLSNLLIYMDGKTGAEELIERVLGDTALLAALAGRAALASEAAAPTKALDALRAATPVAIEEPDAKAAALDALRAATPVAAEEPDDTAAALDALLGSVAEPDPLADLLADAPVQTEPLADLLETTEEADPLAGLFDTPAEPDPLADLLVTPEDADPLAGLFDAPAEPDPLADLLGTAPEDDPIAALLAATDDDPLAALLAGFEDGSALDTLVATTPMPEPEPDPLAGLDDLLAAPLVPETVPEPVPEDDPLAGLEDLLAAPLPEPTPAPEAPVSTLDDLLAGPVGRKTPDAAPSGGPASANPMGLLTASRPSAEALNRPRFRMAVFGDFSGRAVQGKLETGDALARRRAIPLDVDEIDEVIAGFATTIVLPVGAEGKGISVKLGSIDDLHPDELVDKVEIFDALKGLRQRLNSASMAAKAVAEMQGWATQFRNAPLPTYARSQSNAVPADLRLSDFQRLIGDTEGRLAKPSPIGDLIGQIVGPHIVPGPNPEAKALKAGVDESLSTAMRLVLHHPDFQAIEAQWRSIDLLARRIETDTKLEVVLFDVSAAEIAADLSAQDDLSKSGLFRLLNAPLQEEGGCGFSAAFGMYSFEETPPHAQLLGRLARIAAHVDAPFFAAMSPAFLEVKTADRHPMVARAWGQLRELDAAGWLGLVAPRFLLRRPYGERSEPIDAFDFEEFTMAEGLSGMLWANPVVLVAVLLAQAWKKGGRKMTLGEVMSMGDMPYHFATDRHGDQVALPCTERNITTEKLEQVITRGFMPVVSMKGRDVVRLASFQSVTGAQIAGPWAGNTGEPRPAPRQPQMTMDIPSAKQADEDLDALLSGFGDSPTPVDPASIDADLAALLEGL